jgi:hypothetical protein
VDFPGRELADLHHPFSVRVELDEERSRESLTVRAYIV